MLETNFSEFERLFLALGDKTRLRLLALMADGPVAVGFLADRLGESQPKVSRHLAYLRNAGVVYTKRDGKWIYYGIRYPEDASLRRILEKVVQSIAVMRVDGQYVYFTGADTYTEQAIGQEDNIYGKTDVYETANNGEEDLVTNEDVYEEDIYEREIEEPKHEPEEIDIFLL